MKVTSISFFTIPILVLIGLFTFTSPGSGQVLKTYQGSNVGGGGQGTVYNIGSFTVNVTQPSNLMVNSLYQATLSGTNLNGSFFFTATVSDSHGNIIASQTTDALVVTNGSNGTNGPGTGIFTTPLVPVGTYTISYQVQCMNLTSNSASWNVDVIGASVIGYPVTGGTASGTSALAPGFNSTASGANSLSLGDSSTASGANSLALGQSSAAEGLWSLSLGNSSAAYGSYATSLGYYSNAQGNYSVAGGAYSSAMSYGQFTVGQYNLEPSTASATSWVATDDLFTVGNGQDSTHLSNAFSVNKEGDSTISGKLVVGGAILITPQGDLSMGAFTAGPTH